MAKLLNFKRRFINYSWFLFYAILIFACENKSLKGTKWKICKVSFDSNFTGSDSEKALLSNFVISKNIYSYYTGTFVITYIGHSKDSTLYKQNGNKINFFPIDTVVSPSIIVHFSNDTLKLKSETGS